MESGLMDSTSSVIPPMGILQGERNANWWLPGFPFIISRCRNEQVECLLIDTPTHNPSSATKNFQSERSEGTSIASPPWDIVACAYSITSFTQNRNAVMLRLLLSGNKRYGDKFPRRPLSQETLLLLASLMAL